MQQASFHDRDLSWLSFNERLLMEAASEDVPLLERIKFLSIYSSNLDEFYRVRIPALMALQKLKPTEKKHSDLLHEISTIVQEQQSRFGMLLTQQLLPALIPKGYTLIYDHVIPEAIQPAVTAYFFSAVLGFLRPVSLHTASKSFFPENNKIYLFAVLEDLQGNTEELILNIPSDSLPRFFTVSSGNMQYILFLDDIIRDNLQQLFFPKTVAGCYSFKITRDAELNLKDEYAGDLAEKIEEQLAKRDFGLATRFLYAPDLPLRHVHWLAGRLGIAHAGFVKGGDYHHLRDLASLPVHHTLLEYPQRTPVKMNDQKQTRALLSEIAERDIIIHTPYQQYATILRFFNEAALHRDVTEIYTTLYRVASDSRIVHALMSAAANGKKVTVLIEIKARFDEENNIEWAKRMKKAGIRIIYSRMSLKVHAKIALVKKMQEGRASYTGLFSTGNLNESTARYYTDHILLTAHPAMMQETELLFLYLCLRKKPGETENIHFKQLLVSQFNLQERFLELIDREIAHAQQGLPAAITIKLNNLEEQVLIRKLYQASEAGVKINLIVRTICCLIPGVAGMSSNITVKRIVDRYLEHGRVFIFRNNGKEEIFMGSADWMNRNIYRRIEVCVPLYDEAIKKQIKEIISLQWNDNTKAVILNEQLENIRITPVEKDTLTRSQEAIYAYINTLA